MNRTIISIGFLEKQYNNYVDIYNLFCYYKNRDKSCNCFQEPLLT